MIYPAVSCLKKELYEITQEHLAAHACKESETVRFTEKEMAGAEWKEEKEFILNGYSYDVIKVHSVSGTKYYVCYRDKKDIVMNSLVAFSKKLTVKKLAARRQIDLPAREKSICKTSVFFVVSGHKEINSGGTSYITIIPDYDHQLKNTAYLSVIIPPPEMGMGTKGI